MFVGVLVIFFQLKIMQLQQLQKLEYLFTHGKVRQRKNIFGALSKQLLANLIGSQICF